MITLEIHYELVSLNGNITKNGNQYYTHIHATLSDENFHAISGHIAAAEIGVTLELTIVPFSASVERVVDKETGFGPILSQ